MIETTVGVATAFAIVMFGLGVMVALKAGATAASWREQDLRDRLSIERMRPHMHDAGLCQECASVAMRAVSLVGDNPVRGTAVLYYPALVQMGGGAEGWAENERVAPEDEEDATARPAPLPEPERPWGQGAAAHQAEEVNRAMQGQSVAPLDGGPARR